MEDQPNNKGRFLYYDNSSYEGEVKDGKIEGFGVMEKEGFRYEGEWMNEKKNG